MNSAQLSCDTMTVDMFAKLVRTPREPLDWARPCVVAFFFLNLEAR